MSIPKHKKNLIDGQDQSGLQRDDVFSVQANDTSKVEKKKPKRKQYSEDEAKQMISRIPERSQSNYWNFTDFKASQYRSDKEHQLWINNNLMQIFKDPGKGELIELEDEEYPFLFFSLKCAGKHASEDGEHPVMETYAFSLDKGGYELYTQSDDSGYIVIDGKEWISQPLNLRQLLILQAWDCAARKYARTLENGKSHFTLKDIAEVMGLSRNTSFDNLAWLSDEIRMMAHIMVYRSLQNAGETYKFTETEANILENSMNGLQKCTPLLPIFDSYRKRTKSGKWILHSFEIDRLPQLGNIINEKKMLMSIPKKVFHNLCSKKNDLNGLAFKYSVLLNIDHMSRRRNGSMISFEQYFDVKKADEKTIKCWYLRFKRYLDFLKEEAVIKDFQYIPNKGFDIKR